MVAPSFWKALLSLLRITQPVTQANNDIEKQCCKKRGGHRFLEDTPLHADGTGGARCRPRPSAQPAKMATLPALPAH